MVEGVENNFNFDDELNKVSRKYGKNKQEVAKEALRVYEDYLDLLNEFNAWDKITDEDFLTTDKK